MKNLLFMFLLCLILLTPIKAYSSDYHVQDDPRYTRIKEVKVRWFDDKALADQCAQKTNGEVFKNEGYHPYVVIYGARILDVVVIGGYEMKVNICE